jgi:membrane peptidoglycan carboxypeptidase
VLESGPLGKLGAGAQIAVMSAAAGALVAALALPAVGTAGLAARNAATNFNKLATPELGQLPVRSEILDRYGHVLAYYYPRGIDRMPVSFTQISPVMRQAIVAIEDARFYSHGALDFRGTVRALVNNLEHKPVQGGSTLAQQYVKNVEILSSPNPQQAIVSATADTIGRKIRELRMAVRVEHTMTKNEILAGYLNVAYFGNQAYGVQVAARRYFNTSASRLTLPQAAMLAGLVENPAQYNPLFSRKNAITRRNTVLNRMAQLHDITRAEAIAAESQPLRLHLTAPQSGCTSRSAQYAGYFCDYVLAVMRHDAAYKQVWARLNGAGGLKIVTTLDPMDQRAAQRAVNYEMPPPPSSINPGRNAISEVLIEPGTGHVRAIAIDRPYGTGRHQNTVNYAVGPQYDGSAQGVQIGSVGKVYVMVAALLQHVPFGYSKTVGFSANVGGYTNCAGQPVGNMLPDGQLGWKVHNDESEKGGHYTLYTGTTASINVFYAYLEQKVGLCESVRAADRMGLTWPDGVSLLKRDPGLSRVESRQTGHRVAQAPADNFPTFALGAMNVTPMSVAAADATLPARGIYCNPVAISRIQTMSGKKLPVESAGCHRVLPTEIADAANYILQGDLNGIGTAANDSIGRPAASKTGTADTYRAAFFVGYTPDLLGAVWVGNPTDPQNHPMRGYPGSCYRAGCLGFMYGSMAPGQTWQLTFLHAHLANPPLNFVPVPPTSDLFRLGNGIVSPIRHHHGGGGGNHHHHGGPSPSPSPSPSPGPTSTPSPTAVVVPTKDLWGKCDHGSKVTGQLAGQSPRDCGR